MYRMPFFLGSLSMAVAVIMGAWGAHGAEPYLGPERMEAYRTAVDYQIYHSIGMMLIGLIGGDRFRSRLRLAFFFFLAGILFFSGSLYILSTQSMMGLEGMVSFLGPVTPLGGLSFILGWLMLAVVCWKWGGNVQPER